MGLFGVIAVVVGALSGAAEAGPFSSKSSQGELARRSVDRTHVLPKGWLELGLRLDHKSSDQYRGADGGLREQPAGMTWQHSRAWLEVQQGFSSRVMLYARIPYVRSSLLPATGNDITTLAMGDAHTGVVFQPFRLNAIDVAFSADLKAPSGVEWPKDTGGPGNTGSFLTGTGITNVGLFAHVAWRYDGLLKASASTGYVRKIPGIVGYVVATEGFGNGVINPGDEWSSTAELKGNVTEYAWARVGADFRRMGETKIGINGDGERQMDPVRHSAGQWLDVSAALGFEPTEHWLVEAGASLDRLGGDTRPFAHLGLEEFSPQPGLEWSGKVAVRW
jgi:hypothetical protein